jgi:pimeloyl-ACP methyl ester carboxylesterase
MRRKALRDPEASARRAIPDEALCAQTMNDPEAGPLFRALQSSTMERMAERIAGTKNDIAQSREPFDYPLEQLRSPVLVVHGSADDVAPFALSEHLAVRAPCAELLATNGGHVTLFTHRAVIQPRVRRFLEAHAGA